MALCAYLGITQADVEQPVSYITVLGMSQRGRELLKKARQHGKLPIITKPATAKKMTEEIKKQFERQALITDLYTLAFPNPFQRNGGMEWKSGPFILKEETEP